MYSTIFRSPSSVTSPLNVGMMLSYPETIFDCGYNTDSRIYDSSALIFAPSLSSTVVPNKPYRFGHRPFSLLISLGWHVPHPNWLNNACPCSAIEPSPLPAPSHAL